MSALCSLSARGVYGPTVPLKSLTNTHTHACTHALLLYITNTSPGLPLFLQALIYRSSVRVKGGLQMEKCVFCVGGLHVCVSVCTSMHICTFCECTCVRCVRGDQEKRSPLQSGSKMPWKWSLCLAALLFFPLIIVNVRLILPALP